MVEPLPRLVTGTAPEAVAVLGEHGAADLPFDAGPLPELPDDSPILRAVHTPFNLEGFAVARTPLAVGNVAIGDLPNAITVADMVVKWPGLGYRLPAELTAVGGWLARCAAVEKRINPHADDYFAYLTLQHAPVRKDEIKRGEGAHSDSVQGPRVQPKQPIEHGYTSASCDPTRFFTHAFDLSGLDADRDWLNPAFEHQADPSRAVQLTPNQIALFDAYTIHEAVPATAAAMRTFVRLIFSVRRFDRLGNTVNALFDYGDWQFQPRPLPPGLRGVPTAS